MDDGPNMIPQGASADPFADSQPMQPTAMAPPSSITVPPMDDEDAPYPVEPQESPMTMPPLPPPAPEQGQQSPISFPSASQSVSLDVFMQDTSVSTDQQDEAMVPVASDPPSNEAKYTATTEALKRQIASRTAAMDASTKEKEAKILEAAKQYIKKEQTKRESHLKDVRANHQKNQKEGAQKIDAYKKSGAMWSAVGMLVDLKKPNNYSKGTERMRALLGTLSESQKATVK